MNQYNRKFKFIDGVGQFFIDLLCLYLGLWIAHVVRFPGQAEEIRRETLVISVFMLLISVLFQLVTDSYGHLLSRGYLVELIQVTLYSFVLLVSGGFYVYAFRQVGDYSRLMLGYAAFFIGLLTYCFRCLFKVAMYRYFKSSMESEKLVIITDAEEWPLIRGKLLRHDAWGYHVSGVVLWNLDYAPAEASEQRYMDGYEIVAGRRDVLEIIQKMSVDTVLFCGKGFANSEVKNLLESFLEMGIQCHDGVDRLQVDAPWRSVGRFVGIPVMSYSMVHFDYRKRILKRCFDEIGGLVGCLFTLLFILPIGLAIKLDSPGPVFFSQVRVGKNGRRFRIYKFRSMYIDAEERKAELKGHNEMQGPVFKVQNDPRITKVGYFLRRTSLDELPQFFNILKGDMSLVGTRPPTEDEFNEYTAYYRRRLAITPGLTGLWQVSGRSEITNFNEIVRLDLEYIDNWSLTLDLKILLKTFLVVFQREGAK